MLLQGSIIPIYESSKIGVQPLDSKKRVHRLVIHNYGTSKNAVLSNFLIYKSRSVKIYGLKLKVLNKKMKIPDP